MATDSRAVSVTTSATRLDTANKTDNIAGSAIAVYNNGAAIVHLGEADVTAANGYPLAPGEHYSEDLWHDSSLYGRAASGTVDVRVREVGI